MWLAQVMLVDQGRCLQLAVAAGRLAKKPLRSAGGILIDLASLAQSNSTSLLPPE